MSASFTNIVLPIHIIACNDIHFMSAGSGTGGWIYSNGGLKQVLTIYRSVIWVRCPSPLPPYNHLGSTYAYEDQCFGLLSPTVLPNLKGVRCLSWFASRRESYQSNVCDDSIPIKNWTLALWHEIPFLEPHNTLTSLVYRYLQKDGNGSAGFRSSEASSSVHRSVDHP